MIRQIIRTLTPLGWLAVIIGLVVAVAVVSASWGRLWSWLPWSTESRAERAEDRTARAEDQADASTLTAEGEADQVRRLDTYHHQVVTVQAVTAAAAAEARRSDDAETPIHPDRLDRLRAHDRELCRLAPSLAGCGAASDAP